MTQRHNLIQVYVNLCSYLKNLLNFKFEECNSERQRESMFWKKRKKRINLLLFNYRFIYKIGDFGAARVLHEDGEFDSIYGTEEYLVILHT